MKIIERILQVFIVVWLLIGHWLQIDSGLADQGDYSRIMTIFTSGPVGIEPNWPNPNTQWDLWKQRFDFYWLPYWKLDFPNGFRLWQEDFNSSSIWLWYPGVLANWLIYSHDILYLPAVSLLPRLFMIFFMLLVFWWIDHSGLSPGKKVVLAFTLGIPLVLFLVNHNYVVILNTFYTQTALMIFLLAFLASLIFLKRQPSIWRYILCIFTLFLLTIGKASAIYWPFLGLLFIFPIEELFSKPGRYLARYLFLACSLSIVAFVFTRHPAYTVQVNAYNSLFNGVLAYSEDAPARLAEMGMTNAEMCVGNSSWTDTGRNCFSKPYIIEKISFRNTLYVVSKEPFVVPRLFKFAIDNMQEIPLGQGDRAAGDIGPNLANTGLNLWTQLKQTTFPTGYTLLIVWILLLALFGFACRKSGIVQELGIIGLITSLAMMIDIIVAISGEGRTDLIKHLFFSNYLFDLSVIAALNTLVLLIIAKYQQTKVIKFNGSSESDIL